MTAATLSVQRRRKCHGCREPFVRARPLQVACSMDCAAKVAWQKREKEDRRLHRERKRAAKPYARLVAEAQAAVNRYVRLRDVGKPCISCQRHHTGQWHAGHYRSTAAAPELRFDLDNLHAQCAPCNTYLSGNLVRYRVGLLERIGPERLAALEGPHPARKWTRDELIALRRQFQAMARALEEVRA